MARPFLAVLFFVAAALFVAAPAASQDAAKDRRVEARVDPRVELLSVVFRLAGNGEYAMGKVDAYTKAVDAHFGKQRDHAVVKHASALGREHHVAFDAVMGLAVHLDDQFQLAMPVEKAVRLDARWPRSELPAFVDELRKFAKDADAAAFFRKQRPLYELTAKRMQAVIDAHVRLSWFDAWFGARPGAKFELALGLGNGPCNYGPSVLRADGKEELHCVLGVWQVDAEGQPTFGEDVVPTVVHEFCHSYCNPVVEARLDELADAGRKLWPPVAEAMGRMAYADAATMFRESLVRACVVRYQAANAGADAAKNEIAEQVKNSFLWTGELSDVLAEYEKFRTKYATLDAFMPRVVQFFADYAARTPGPAASAEPQVVSMTPANGATDVDPALAAITITFDRPMMDQCWALVGGGPLYPKFSGRPSYDADRRVLTAPVELKPSTSYEFWLNRGQFDSFQSAEGVKLTSVHVTFTTRAN